MDLNSMNTVVELCPGPDKPALYFTEIFVSDTFKIPPQKPDKDRIANVRKTVTLEDVQTVTIDIDDSGVPDYEKVFVAGNIYLDVQYISTYENQSVHFVRFQLPFQTIILDDCGDPLPYGTLPEDYVVHVCIEKINEEQIDERTILFEVLLLVWLEDAS